MDWRSKIRRWLIAGTLCLLASTPALGAMELISFSTDGFRLAGTLQLPATEGPHPVVIMVHGDGEHTRSDWGHYAPLAERFLRAGYAVFSWDSPGVRGSTGAFGHDERFRQRTDILLAAVARMKEHSSIDSTRIGCWGISQAGYIMTLALRETDDISFLVMVGCPAANTYAQGAYLGGQLAVCAGYSEEEGRQLEAWSLAMDSATTYETYLANATPMSESSILHELGIFVPVIPEDEWQPDPRDRWTLFNPADVLKSTTIPVLALFGALDRQVDPIQGASAFRAALEEAGNTNYQIEVIPGADHGIVLSETGCLTEIRGRSSAEALMYAPEYLDLVELWLTECPAGS